MIEAYSLADVPLIVPVTLLNHYVRKFDQPYLRGQYYLHLTLSTCACAAIAEEPCSNRNSIVPKTGNTWQRNCAVCFNSSYIWCSPPTTVRRPTPAFSKPALSSEMTGPLVEFQCMKAGRKGNLDSCRQTPLYEHCHDHACAAHG